MAKGMNFKQKPSAKTIQAKNGGKSNKWNGGRTATQKAIAKSK